MARIRSDKPEAYQSETLAEISLAAERTFKGMATIADDRGRLADKPAQINGELWSMRGSHARDDLEAELIEMAGVGLVCRYVGCDGKRYLHMPSWDQHQKIDRPSKSRLPRCPQHQGEPDYCGKHEGDCKPVDSWGLDAPSRESREGSRDLQPAENGLDADVGNRESLPLNAPVDNRPAVSEHLADQEEQKASRECREPSMQDLGSRILDLGSKPPPTPPVTPRLTLVPSEAKPEGEDFDQERETLITKVRGIRPDWSSASIRRVLRSEAVAERPWPLVQIAALTVARDPESKHPGRLAHDGPWWHSGEPAATSVPKPPWCGHCDEITRLIGDDEPTRCSACHPLRESA